MKLALALVVAALIVPATVLPSAAQSPFPPAGAPAGGVASPQTADGKSCQTEFIALQEERGKRGQAFQDAQKRKADRAEFCTLIKSFNAAEVKMIKFMETNNVWCGIPMQLVTQIKGVNAKTVQAVKQVCSGGGGPAGPPPPPSLSEALGTSRPVDSGTPRAGRGTYDTLTGSPLGR